MTLLRMLIVRMTGMIITLRIMLMKVTRQLIMPRNDIYDHDGNDDDEPIASTPNCSYAAASLAASTSRAGPQATFLALTSFRRVSTAAALLRS